jgi:psiF repeat
VALYPIVVFSVNTICSRTVRGKGSVKTSVKTIEGSSSMYRTVALGIITAALITMPARADFAQEKPLAPQQQKMKDCAVRWKDEKVKTNVKGREAYRSFLSSCLKSATT